MVFQLVVFTTTLPCTTLGRKALLKGAPPFLNSSQTSLCSFVVSFPKKSVLFLDHIVRVSSSAFNKVLAVPISPHGASPVCRSHEAKGVRVAVAADFAPGLAFPCFTRALIQRVKKIHCVWEGMM